PLSQQEAMGASRAAYVRTDHRAIRVNPPSGGGRGARIIECDESVLCRGRSGQKSKRTEDVESCASRHFDPSLASWPVYSGLARSPLTNEKSRERGSYGLVEFFERGMSGAPSQDLSQLLTAWSEGDQQALNDLMSAVYPEIRKIARQRLRQTPQETLESAAVANEAYVRLFQARGIRCENRLMFFALCAQVI